MRMMAMRSHGRRELGNGPLYLMPRAHWRRRFGCIGAILGHGAPATKCLYDFGESWLAASRMCNDTRGLVGDGQVGRRVRRPPTTPIEGGAHGHGGAQARLADFGSNTSMHPCDRSRGFASLRNLRQLTDARYRQGTSQPVHKVGQALLQYPVSCIQHSVLCICTADTGGTVMFVLCTAKTNPLTGLEESAAPD